MKTNVLKIKKLNEKAILPTKGSVCSAGYDLYALLERDLEILPHSTVKINTGLAMEIPMGTFGGIFARSGLATKQGLRPANCTGVIDADYRGEVIVCLHNDGDNVQVVKNGDRIAQLVVIKCPVYILMEVDKLSDTERGVGGFGSTGS